METRQPRITGLVSVFERLREKSFAFVTALSLPPSSENLAIKTSAPKMISMFWSDGIDQRSS
jgi:hypothetical protein